MVNGGHRNPGEVAHNFLVVSDLHLGEELLPGAGPERQYAVGTAADAFVEFLRHHQARRAEGRAWRLVINGDLFDFMSVNVEGDEASPTAGVRYSRTKIRAAAQMRTLARVHRPVLAQLMRFVAAGHQVDIITGNHDRELAWPNVAAVFREELAMLAPQGVDGHALAQSVAIHPWFVFEPGVVWIEHGDRYDEQCSTEYHLAPEDPRDSALCENVDYAAACTVGRAAPDLDIHGTEGWGFGGFVSYCWGRGAKATLELLVSYVAFVRRLALARKQHQLSPWRNERKASHDAAVTTMAADSSLPATTLSRIDALASTPITANRGRLARLLMMDRWAAVAATATTFALAITLLSLVPALLLTIAVGIGTSEVAKRSAAAQLASQLPMQQVPDAVCSELSVPTVVFGHSHAPLRQTTSSGGVYLNSGTWLPAIRPGLLRAFTHVTIINGVAELRQWRGHASHLFVEVDRSQAAVAIEQTAATPQLVWQVVRQPVVPPVPTPASEQLAVGSAPHPVPQVANDSVVAAAEVRDESAPLTQETEGDRVAA